MELTPFCNIPLVGDASQNDQRGGEEDRHGHHRGAIGGSLAKPRRQSVDRVRPHQWSEEGRGARRQQHQTEESTGLSIGPHPLELLRAHLPAATLSSRELHDHPAATVAVAGMAIARQRPATANGVVFMLIEDEFGQVNLIVPPSVYERYRAVVRGEPLILARGRFEKVERNENVLVRELESLGPLARRIADEEDVHGSLPGAHHFGHR